MARWCTVRSFLKFTSPSRIQPKANLWYEFNWCPCFYCCRCCSLLHPVSFNTSCVKNSCWSAAVARGTDGQQPTTRRPTCSVLYVRWFSPIAYSSAEPDNCRHSTLIVLWKCQKMARSVRTTVESLNPVCLGAPGLKLSLACNLPLFFFCANIFSVFVILSL